MGACACGCVCVRMCVCVCCICWHVCMCMRTHICVPIPISDPCLYENLSSLFPKTLYPVLHYVNRHYPITFKEFFTVLADVHQELTHIGKKEMFFTIWGVSVAQVLSCCKCILDRGACKRWCCLGACSGSYLFSLSRGQCDVMWHVGVSILKTLVWLGCITGSSSQRSQTI